MILCWLLIKGGWLEIFLRGECQCTIQLKQIIGYLEFTEHWAGILRSGDVEYKENPTWSAFTEVGNEMGKTVGA